MAYIATLFAQARGHFQAGRLERVGEVCQQILAIDPGHAESLHLMGSAALQIGRFELAADLVGAAIAIDPGIATYHSSLGNALLGLDRLEEAALCHRRAIALRPDLAEAHNNLGTVLSRQRRLAEAADCFRAALARGVARPGIVRYNLAVVLLAQGDLAGGLAEYEWRRHTPHGAQAWRDLPQPRWRGEPACGARLLVYAEQGLGDTLNFCRYAEMAAARGLRVILEVQEPLVRLLRRLPWVEQVVAPDDPVPPFDLQCPMLSLMLAFPPVIPPARLAWLSADPASVARWRVRLGRRKGPRVGLVWAGNPRTLADARRSLPPDRLRPLLDVPGVRFFSLQKDGPAGLELEDHMAGMRDFADTAALVANLDLVIAVDTAVAHLAAGLGRPVWLLDRFDSCWRWFVGRRDSPWYPSLRIYRQPAAGDWDSVLAEVREDLARWVAPSARPRA
jgi:hypothetical protein